MKRTAEYVLDIAGAAAVMVSLGMVYLPLAVLALGCGCLFVSFRLEQARKRGSN